MKNLRILFLSLMTVTLCTVAFVACSDDDFTETIFDTHEYPLDRSLYTFPLDTFIKKNFQEPYNLRFIYRMEDIGSDLQKNLIPADYDKSVKLAVLSKYLWYDCYDKFGGVDFLKQNSPRIIHLIGSASYNPTSGTETLGTAEGGLKITLYKVNHLQESEIDLMNKYFFHVMHHEFGHILDQTHLRPTEFNLLSNGHYDALDWGNKSDSLTAGWGFVTPYASSQAREDWVETLASYLTDSEKKWNALLNTASVDWEEIDILEDDLDADYYSKLKPGADIDSIGYLDIKANGDYKVVRKVVERDPDGYALLNGDGKLIFVDTDGVNGRDLILEKLQMVRTWLKDYFNIDVDALRYEIQHRQYASDAEGNFLFDTNGNYINNLTSPSPEDPSRTVMEVLLDQVNQYKALQTK